MNSILMVNSNKNINRYKMITGEQLLQQIQKLMFNLVNSSDLCNKLLE